MISADEHGDKDRAGNDAGGKEFLRGQADKVFPVHVRIPCSFWIGYKMETPRNVLNIKGNEMKSSRNCAAKKKWSPSVTRTWGTRIGQASSEKEGTGRPFS
jgi:hypothetical protein